MFNIVQSETYQSYCSFLILASFLHTFIIHAYGMGSLEKVAYDSKEKILYGISEQGFVSSSSGGHDVLCCSLDKPV